MLPIIALQTLYGASVPISKFLLSLCTPIYFSGIRMFLAGSVLIVGKIWYNSKKFIIKKEHLWLYVQTALFGIYFKYILRNWGLVSLPAVKMVFLLNSTPFIAALFSYISFKEVYTKKQWVGLLIGFAGLVPILILKAPAEQTTIQIFSLSLPELAIFAAVVCHTYGMISARKLIREHGNSSVMVNGVRMFLGGFFALLTGMFFEGLFPISNAPLFAGWLLVLIIVSNVICHSLYMRLLKWYSVTFLSFSDFLSPFATAFYSWLFLKETISWHYFASGLIVFIGLFLFYQDELRQVNGQM